jgi:hypothetical protein
MGFQSAKDDAVMTCSQFARLKSGLLACRRIRAAGCWFKVEIDSELIHRGALSPLVEPHQATAWVFLLTRVARLLETAVGWIRMAGPLAVNALCATSNRRAAGEQTSLVLLEIRFAMVVCAVSLIANPRL